MQSPALFAGVLFAENSQKAVPFLKSAAHLRHHFVKQECNFARTSGTYPLCTPGAPEFGFILWQQPIDMPPVRSIVRLNPNPLVNNK
jgi:hypothetical protein